MHYEDIAQARRSIRGYKSDPIPREVLEEIIHIAKQAPSSMNTQPWHFHVLTGEPLERIRKGNTEKMMAGSSVDREIKLNHGYEGPHRERQVEIAVQLFEAMGIKKDDKEKRMDWMLRGFRQFDAPVSLILTYDKYLEPAAISQFALGSLAYGIVLAAWERGIGCVINGQGIMQSHIVREHAKIPDDQNIMICIAMGYPDNSFAANDVRSIRANNKDFVKYIGFDKG